MIIDFRTPVFAALIFFFIVIFVKDEDTAFIAGYLLSTMVFVVTAIFSKP